MIIKTKDFQDAANKILLAADLDKSAANLELLSRKDALYLNVTNKEFYVSVKFPLENGAEFDATVDASLFLNLISGISVDEFSLSINGNALVVNTGGSNYKLPMIFEGNAIMKLPEITIESEPTVEMYIETAILNSILTINRRELIKAKNLDVNELQRLYYIDETGCFTFTTGACLNAFTLAKPVKLLLNDRIVRLFKLFNTESVKFAMGQDVLPNGTPVTKAVFATDTIYVAALISCDPVLLGKIQGPCNATKQLIFSPYDNQVVLSANKLMSAVSRLMLFTKNSIANANMALVSVKATLSGDSFFLEDSMGNKEEIKLENDSFVAAPYVMQLNLPDLKFVLDGYKNDYVTLNCGNHRSVIITRGTIYNLIPEGSK